MFSALEMKIIFGLALTLAGMFITTDTLKMQVWNVTKSVKDPANFSLKIFAMVIEGSIAH